MKILVFCILCLCLVVIFAQFQEASAMFCFTPHPKPPVNCSGHGDCFTPDTAVSNIPNKCVDLSAKFNSPENSTNKDLHFRFFYTNANQTMNQTINNVSFFINMTKQSKTLEHDLFFTHSGIFTIKFQQNDQVGQWAIDGDHDPVLGGWTSPNDTVTVHSSSFTNGGLYHFNTKILTLDYANTMVDQTSPPTFDYWWSVDDNGNISKYDNDTNVTSLKQEISPVRNAILPPLKQIDSGIPTENIVCSGNLELILKASDNFPACVKHTTAEKLIQRGWGFSKDFYLLHDKNSTKGTLPIDGTQFVSNYTITNANLNDIKQDKNSLAIILSISPHSDGTVAITIPRSLLVTDSKNEHYAGLYVLNDGMQNSDFREIDMKTNMTLIISFVNPTREIEIIGTYY